MIELEDYREASGANQPTYEQFCREYENWLNSEAFKNSLDEQEDAR